MLGQRPYDAGPTLERLMPEYPVAESAERFTQVDGPDHRGDWGLCMVGGYLLASKEGRSGMVAVPWVFGRSDLVKLIH
jgi:hypothetical protein